MHVILWESRVRRGQVRADAPRGVWAEPFQQGEGYIGPELLRDLGERERYFTIDRWSSHAGFAWLRNRHRGEYEALDRHCEVMTESETQVGSFSPVSSPVPD